MIGDGVLLLYTFCAPGVAELVTAFIINTSRRIASLRAVLILIIYWAGRLE